MAWAVTMCAASAPSAPAGSWGGQKAIAATMTQRLTSSHPRAATKSRSAGNPQSAQADRLEQDIGRADQSADRVCMVAGLRLRLGLGAQVHGLHTQLVDPRAARLGRVL